MDNFNMIKREHKKKECLLRLKLFKERGGKQNESDDFRDASTKIER